MTNVVAAARPSRPSHNPARIIWQRPRRRLGRAPHSVRRRTLAQETEEFDALAQAPHHHLGARDHLAHDRGDLAGAKIESPIEGLDAVEDLLVRQVRIMQRRDLDAVFVDELGVLGMEPAVLDRLVVEEGAGIGRRQGDLDGVRIDLVANLMVSWIVSLVSPGRPRMKVPWMVMPSSWQSRVKRRATS